MRTALGYFESRPEALSAIAALQSSGVAKRNISLKERYVRRKPDPDVSKGFERGGLIGAALAIVPGFVVTMEAFYLPYEPQLWTVETLMTVLMGIITAALAGASVGGLIGGLTVRRDPDEREIDRLEVRARVSDAFFPTAMSILTQTPMPTASVPSTAPIDEDWLRFRAIRIT